jgi:phospholipid transport system substrate-binding protein
MFSRFTAKCVTTLFFACFVINAYAQSYSDSDASSFVNKVNNTVFTIIKNQTLSTQEKDQKLKNVLTTHINIDWVGKFVLGKHWRSATKMQRSRYLKAYRQYVMYNYLTRFRDYKNQQIVLKKTSGIDNNNFLVAATLKEPNETDVLLDYLIHADSKNTLRIYDFKVEGVSMINTQRADFNSAISRKSLNHFIARLENMAERNAQVASR